MTCSICSTGATGRPAFWISLPPMSLRHMPGISRVQGHPGALGSMHPLSWVFIAPFFPVFGESAPCSCSELGETDQWAAEDSSKLCSLPLAQQSFASVGSAGLSLTARLIE